MTKQIKCKCTSTFSKGYCRLCALGPNVNGSESESELNKVV